MKLGPKSGMRNESGGSGEPEASTGKPMQPEAPRGKASARRTPKRGFLDGQMLIAMQTMGDERFARSVIYVCAHSNEGALGIIVNQAAPHITFGDLLVQLEVLPAGDAIEVTPQARGLRGLRGGPIDTR